MPKIMMNISRIVGQTGKLLNVESYCFPEVPDQLACLYLQFEKGNCVIGVNEDTNEIIVSESDNFRGLVAISNNPIWNQFIKKNLLWDWELINNQGYKDGLRLEFKDSDLSI